MFFRCWEYCNRG